VHLALPQGAVDGDGGAGALDDGPPPKARPGHRAGVTSPSIHALPSDLCQQVGTGGVGVDHVETQDVGPALAQSDCRENADRARPSYRHLSIYQPPFGRTRVRKTVQLDK
jgi:hypothetical protein